MFATALFQSYQLALTAISLIREDGSTDFQGLGKLMLGGFVLALGVGVAFTVIRARLRDKKPAVATFISINSFKEK
jgi:hypothetical protein